MAFRKKFQILKEMNADIIVIQESENPERYPEEFSKLNMYYI